ncbi:MAG: BatD family protein [Oligoflexia bacterium]|nr:BatD family protein [Oligoflexia bacterium]
MEKTGKFILQNIIIAICYIPLAFSAPSITTFIKPNPAVEGESLQFTISVSTDQSVPIFEPEFTANEFHVLGSSYGAEFSQINNKVEKKTRFSFVLMPTKSGNLTIRNIKVKVANDIITSPDINVVVQKSNNNSDDEDTNPASPNNFGKTNNNDNKNNSHLPNRFNSDFTVVASVNKTKAYVGEPINVEYNIYDFGAIRQTIIQKWPSFNGFWKEELDITKRITYNEVYVKGDLMRKAFISRYAIYGLRPGKFNLDKLEVKGMYVYNPGGMSGFGIFDMKSGLHASQSIPLEIVPLPTVGAPANFAGAVGGFQISAKINSTVVEQNTPITLSLELLGNGNFHSIEAPEVKFPSDFEIYDSSSEFIKNNSQITTGKTFNYIAIPRAAGKFEIPSISFSYFDVNVEKYKTIETKSIQLEVTPSDKSFSDTNIYLQKNAKNNPNQTNSTPLTQPMRTFDYKYESSFAKKSFLIFITLIIVNFILALFIYGQFVSNTFSKARLKLDPYAKPKQKIKSIRKDQKIETLLSQIEDIIIDISDIKLGYPTRGLTISQLETSWHEYGFSNAVLTEIKKIHQEIAEARYAKNQTLNSQKVNAERILTSISQLLTKI